MIKIFLKNSLVYTIGTILTRGIAIILLPVYTRYLSPAEYGIVDLFFILSSIVALTIALEIFQAVARFYPEAKSLKDKMEYVSTAFWFTFIVNVLYVIISIINAEYFTILLLDEIKYLSIFYLATLSIATGGIFYFTSNQLKWQLQPKDSVVVSVLQTSIVAFTSISLLFFSDLKIESIFIGQIFGNIIGSTLSIYYARDNYKMNFDYTKFKEMIHISFPLVFSGVAIFISLFIDRIFIKELLGLDELGIYGLAYKIAAIASLVMIGFQSSMMPLVYKHYQEKETPAQISRLFNLFALFALFVVMGSILFSKEAVVFMSTEAYYGAAPLIPIIIMAVFFNNMYIFAPGLGIAKKTKIVMLISFISAIINILFNALLIPYFGVIGAAYSTLLSGLFVLIIRINRSNKYYKINYEYFKLITSFLIILVISFALNTILKDINIMNIFVKVIMMIIVTYIIASIIFGISETKKIWVMTT
jgi:O-antigen/teichoic acid export membrane protein